MTAKFMSTIDINQISVQSATSPHEIDNVETALSCCNHLGYRSPIGARMFYLALHKGKVVAVMIFDALSHFNFFCACTGFLALILYVEATERH
jgi:hypothetical protein